MDIYSSDFLYTHGLEFITGLIGLEAENTQ